MTAAVLSARPSADAAPNALYQGTRVPTEGVRALPPVGRRTWPAHRAPAGGLLRCPALARDPAGRRPAQILLVEDNPGDVRLLREALSESPVSHELSVVENGVDALAFLRREGRFAEAQRPELILLDLTVPLMTGCEVLRDIKRDPDLGRIPVVVLTSSQAPADVLRTYDLQANCYVTKRLDLDESAAAIQSIVAFWCTVATLPPR